MSGGAWERPRLSVALSRIGLKAKPSNASLLSTNALEEYALISEAVEGNRGKDLDGGFFEDFEILDIKQKDLVEDAKSKVATGKGIDSQQLAFDKLHLSTELNSVQLQSACQEALLTIANALGSGRHSSSKVPVSEERLFQYAKQAYHITDDDFVAIQKKVEEQQKPIHYLNVQVIEARNLEAKDANGLSDPYCMMALIKDGEGKKESKDKIKIMVLRQFKSDEIVKLSTIKMATLNPKWNEHFKLPIRDIKTDVLRIDLWDHDDNTVTLDKDNKITSIKGFTGIGRFFKEVLQSTHCSNDTLDDFMGIIEIPLKDVTFPFLEKWFTLQARSSRSNVKGEIKVKLSFSIKKDSVSDNESDHPPLPASIVHKQMLRQFHAYELERFFEKHSTDECWSVELPNQASFILEQHRVQNEITKYQQQAMKFEVLSSLLQFVQMPMDLFSEILESLKTQRSDYSMSHEEDTALAKALDRFTVYAEELIGRHRHVFSPSQPDKCLRFGQILFCVMSIYKLSLFREHYPSRWLTKELQAWLVTSTEHWFNLLVAYNEPLERTHQAVLHGWVLLVNAVNADLVLGSQAYNNILITLNIDYISVTFNTMEKLVCDVIQEALATISKKLQYGLENQDTLTSMFELYLALRDFKEMKSNVPEGERMKDGISNYNDWFRHSVNKWFDMARLKALNRIQRAVEIDEVRTVHAMVQYSASAVDVTCCLGQICVFWNNLQWPDPTSSYVYVTQISDIVSCATIKYGEIVQKHLIDVGYYDTEGQFDVTDKLCIVMNNMEHVLHFLDSVPKVLHFEELMAQLSEIHGKDRAETFEATLAEILVCGKDDMKQKIDTVIEKTGERLKADLMLYLRKIRKAKDELPAQATIVPFLEYLDSNLLTLHDALLQSVFQRILYHIWQVVLSSFHDTVYTAKKKKKPGFHRLYEALQETRDFFYAGGKGIDEEHLNTAKYKDVSEMIFLWKSSTEEVIQAYYKEQCDRQKHAKTQFGSLTIKMFYCQKTKTVQLNILNGKDLPALDVSGHCDPFVSIELCPLHLFPKRKEKSTKVQKQTRFPLFDENFALPATIESCRQPGAILLLTLYDHDMMSDNDIGGEVFIAVADLPGFKDQDAITGFSQISQTEMPLMHGSVTGRPFEVLSERASLLAENFVYYRQQKYDKMVKDCMSAASNIGTKTR